MELRDIEIFLTLGDELHFGRAAENDPIRALSRTVSDIGPLHLDNR